MMRNSHLILKKVYMRKMCCEKKKACPDATHKTNLTWPYIGFTSLKMWIRKVRISFSSAPKMVCWISDKILFCVLYIYLNSPRFFLIIILFKVKNVNVILKETPASKIKARYMCRVSCTNTLRRSMLHKSMSILYLNIDLNHHSNKSNAAADEISFDSPK